MNIKLSIGILGLSLLVLATGCQKQEKSAVHSTLSQSTVSVSQAKSESSQINEASETEKQPELATSEARITYEPGTLLMAVSQNNLEMVREVLTRDSTYLIDEVDSEGNTPLNLAVHANFIELAQVLIDYGADINRQNNISDSPYLYAGAEGRTEILAYMLGHGIPDQSKVNRFGGNALIPAAEKGHLENVQLLLKDGRAAVNFQNNYGYTALIEAVALKDGSEVYQEIIKVLLEYGADQTIKDNTGQTAVDYAKQKGYQQISEILSVY